MTGCTAKIISTCGMTKRTVNRHPCLPFGTLRHRINCRFIYETPRGKLFPISISNSSSNTFFIFFLFGRDARRECDKNAAVPLCASRSVYSIVQYALSVTRRESISTYAHSHRIHVTLTNPSYTTTNTCCLLRPREAKEWS